MKKTIIFSVLFVIFVSVVGFIFAATSETTTSDVNSNSYLVETKYLALTKAELTLNPEVVTVEVKSFRTIEPRLYSVPVVNNKVIVDSYLSQVRFLDKDGNPLNNYFSVQ